MLESRIGCVSQSVTDQSARHLQYDRDQLLSLETLERPSLHVFVRSSFTMSVGCDVHQLVVLVGVLAMLVTRRRCSETIVSASDATVAVVLVVHAARCPSSVQRAAAPSSSSPAAVRRRMSIGFSHVPVDRRR